MAKHKYLVKALSICAAALIFGLSLLPSFVPANAYSDDSLFNGARAFFPLQFSWTSTDGTALRRYTREAVNPISGDTSTAFWYGPSIDGSTYGPIAVITNEEYNLNTGSYYEWTYTLSFMQPVRTIRINLTTPVFVPESISQQAPVLSLRCVDADLTIASTIQGFTINRTVTNGGNQLDMAYTPFNISNTDTLVSEDVWSLALPRGDLYITSISINLASQDASGNTTDWNDLNVITSYMTSTDYAEYVDQVADLGTYTFKANASSEINVDFTGWLVTAISGIWSFEIVPGFSIGGIFAGIMGIALLVAFLKYFAGG